MRKPIYTKNRKVFNEKLEEMYSASLTSNTNKIGRLSVIHLQLKLVNPVLVDEALFEEGLKFMREYVYGHNQFSQKDFEVEKRLLLEEVISKENDKTRYALTRLFDEMCKEELYGARVAGTKEQIEALTLAQFKKILSIILKKR